MKYRPLQPGLLVEGNSDEPYLRHLVKRHLDEVILNRSTRPVQVLGCQLSEVRTTAEPAEVLRAAAELGRDCDLLFVHGDADALDKTLKLVAALAEQRSRADRSGLPIPLVPVSMTESWMLADRTALASVLGAKTLAGYPYTKVSDVENRVRCHGSKKPVTPKQVWKTLLGDDAHDVLTDSAELLVRRTDLAVLKQLPSYRAWCDLTEDALGELGYLLHRR
ncbi:hypothetical protein ACIRL3_44155 [Streptomyces sp. NPDC102384]|uniref:hypothetical protein n=1 Tax=Streptomyces sp. NPDC102384 TaxID=3366166 RepID=UPI0038113C59